MMIKLAGLSEGDFRQLVSLRLVNDIAPVEGLGDGDHVLNQDIPLQLKNRTLKPAAVLIPIIENEGELQVVFTKRSHNLASHSGQISFPGGKIDAEDLDAMSAALRETHEEIGVMRQKIDVLGQMPDYFAGSGYKISPVIGVIEKGTNFTANPEEVDYIFNVPLAYLMNPKNHKIGSKVFDQIERYFYEMPWQKHYIWGVTAGMVRMFYNRVFK